MKLLYTVLVPACLLYLPVYLFTSCLLQLSVVSYFFPTLLPYSFTLLLYCFTTYTNLLQLLGVWYSPFSTTVYLLTLSFSFVPWH